MIVLILLRDEELQRTVQLLEHRYNDLAQAVSEDRNHLPNFIQQAMEGFVSMIALMNHHTAPAQVEELKRLRPTHRFPKYGNYFNLTI